MIYWWSLCQNTRTITGLKINGGRHENFTIVKGIAKCKTILTTQLLCNKNHKTSGDSIKILAGSISPVLNRQLCFFIQKLTRKLEIIEKIQVSYNINTSSVFLKYIVCCWKVFLRWLAYYQHMQMALTILFHYKDGLYFSKSINNECKYLFWNSLKYLTNTWNQWSRQFRNKAKRFIMPSLCFHDLTYCFSCHKKDTFHRLLSSSSMAALFSSSYIRFSSYSVVISLRWCSSFSFTFFSYLTNSSLFIRLSHIQLLFINSFYLISHSFYSTISSVFSP